MRAREHHHGFMHQVLHWAQGPIPEPGPPARPHRRRRAELGLEGRLRLAPMERPLHNRIGGEECGNGGCGCSHPQQRREERAEQPAEEGGEGEEGQPGVHRRGHADEAATGEQQPALHSTEGWGALEGVAMGAMEMFERFHSNCVLSQDVEGAIAVPSGANRCKGRQRGADYI